MRDVKFISIIWLLPLVFMLHDFEEIIFLEWWVNKNKLELLRKYPRIANVYNEISTAAFALGVSEEFIILILITLGSIIFNWYYLWFGVLVGFFIHLVVHIIQWIVFKKYIPAISTTVPAMIYSIYAIYFIYNNSNMEILMLAMWSALGIIIVWFDLIFAHKLARKFNKFIKLS